MSNEERITAWAVAVILCGTWMFGVFAGLMVCELYSAMQNVPAATVEWAISSCEPNGGLAALDRNSVMCVNGAEFKSPPAPSENHLQEEK